MWNRHWLLLQNADILVTGALATKPGSGQCELRNIKINEEVSTVANPLELATPPVRIICCIRRHTGENLTETSSA